MKLAQRDELSHGVCGWADLLEKQGTLSYRCTSAESSCSPPVPVYAGLHGPVSMAGHGVSYWGGAVGPASSAFLSCLPSAWPGTWASAQDSPKLLPIRCHWETAAVYRVQGCRWTRAVKSMYIKYPMG